MKNQKMYFSPSSSGEVRISARRLKVFFANYLKRSLLWVQLVLKAEWKVSHSSPCMSLGFKFVQRMKESWEIAVIVLFALRWDTNHVINDVEGNNSSSPPQHSLRVYRDSWDLYVNELRITWSALTFLFFLFLSFSWNATNYEIVDWYIMWQNLLKTIDRE